MTVHGKFWPLIALVLLATAGVPGFAADRWTLQYQHVDREFDLRLVDVAFIDSQRGVAIGFLESRSRERQRPVNLVTTDGATWNLVVVKKYCSDIFALRAGILFAACEDGIYRSDELGSDWKRVARLKEVEAVWFLNERTGFAVGASKSFYQTQDGGQRWAPVTTTPAISTNPDYTTLRHIHFVNDRFGFVTGWSRPPTNRDLLPDWLLPDRATRQRDTPHINIFADTSDGGSVWRAQEVSMFGEVVTTELGTDQLGLTLVNFSNGFEYPAELFYFEWPTGQMHRVYRDKRHAITDIALPARGPAYLVAVEPTGQLYWSPIPGRLRVMRSHDFQSWTEMEVDYRASARRAVLEAFDENHVWMVTDTGMVLKLQREDAALPDRVRFVPPADQPAESTTQPEPPPAQKKP
jgi:photosystem II stability/assembly factor-like uncharacterized protein